MIPAPDIGHVYPKTGLDADIRFDTTPRFVSAGSCYFDGDSGKVTVSAAAGINGLFGSGGTIACWIKPASDGEGGGGRLVESGTGGYFFFCTSESGSACKLYFNHHWDGDDGSWTTDATELKYGAWIHVAVTYNGGSTGNAPIIYIDGRAVAITEGDTPTGTINADTADKIIGNASADHRTFHGNICNFGMWKGTILTQAQIREVMAATSYAAVQAVVQPTAYYLFSADGDDSTGNYDGALA